MSASVLYWAAASLCAGVASTLGYTLATVPAANRPTLGRRGEARRTALAEHALYAGFEPVLLVLSGWLARLPLDPLRRRIDRHLERSGYLLGLTADELIALSATASVAMGALAGALARSSAYQALFVLVASSVGASLPCIEALQRFRRRARALDQQLPPAIDLVALCMGAGSDFSGAVRMVATTGDGGVVGEELGRVLEELELGSTRRQALMALAERFPSGAVEQFVLATVQAEEKGNPLAEVLGIQAQTLRMRRSVAAEEAAARAGVMMIVPLMLLLACLLLILAGPFIVTGFGFGQ